MLVYYRSIGNYTTLYLEGERDYERGKAYYSFYKMRTLPNRNSSFKVYCHRVPLHVALKRMESFALYLEVHRDNIGIRSI